RNLPPASSRTGSAKVGDGGGACAASAAPRSNSEMVVRMRGSLAHREPQGARRRGHQAIAAEENPNRRGRERSGMMSPMSSRSTWLLLGGLAFAAVASLVLGTCAYFGGTWPQHLNVTVEGPASWRLVRVDDRVQDQLLPAPASK